MRFVVAGRCLAVPVGEDNPVVGEGSSPEREEDILGEDNPEGDILEEGIPVGEDSSPEEDSPVEEGTEAVAVVVAAAVWERIRSPRPRP